MELKGRSALVTGGAGGLGAATVRHLVSIGMGVAIFDRDPSDGTLVFVQAFRPVGPVPNPVNALRDVVVSADGALVYTVGGGTVFGKVVHFDRDPATGLLAFVAQFVEVRRGHVAELTWVGPR